MNQVTYDGKDPLFNCYIFRELHGTFRGLKGHKEEVVNPGNRNISDSNYESEE